LEGQAAVRRPVFLDIILLNLMVAYPKIPKNDCHNKEKHTMNLRDLQYFVVLARLQHFGDAAKQCFISQPTLSMQIKKLEDELGLALFERNNKQVRLTQQGKILAIHAQRVLDDVALLKDAARSIADPFTGELHLGVIPTLAPYLLPLIMPLIQQQFPNLKVWLVEDQTHRLIDKLSNGELDAAVMAIPVHGDFHLQVLFDEPFYFACAVDHPLRGLEKITMDQLAGEAILLLEEGHCLREQAMEVCRLAKAQSLADFTATSLETLRLMVQSGLGITLLPALAREGVNSESLITIPFIEPQPFRQIALYSRPNSAKKICLEAIAQLIARVVTEKLQYILLEN